MNTSVLSLFRPWSDFSPLESGLPIPEYRAWLYLGGDSIAREKLEDRFARKGFRRLGIGPQLDSISRSLRIEYTEWIDQVNAKHAWRWHWWYGIIPSRNPNQSSLFQNLCYLVLLERLLMAGERFTAVVVESDSLARAIANWLPARGFSLKIEDHPSGGSGPVRRFVEFLRRWLFLALSLLFRYFAAFWTRVTTPTPAPLPEQPVLYSTFVFSADITDNGEFRDRYCSPLLDRLARDGVPVVVLPHLVGFRFSYWSMFRRMRLSSTRFLIREDLLGWHDLVAALVFPWVSFFQSLQRVPFRGVDLGCLLREDRQAASVWLGAEGVLTERFLLHMGNTKCRPRKGLLWYENTSWNKAFIRGFRRSFPRRPVHGIQAFLRPPNLTFLFPSRSEFQAGTVPDRIFCTSPSQCALTCVFFHDLDCRPAAPFRYHHLHLPKILSSPPSGPPRILVLLSFIPSEAIDLLRAFGRVFSRFPSHSMVRIRCHPATGEAQVRKLLHSPQIPKEWEFSQEPLLEDLRNSNLVISGATGTAAEAAMLGKPLVLYANPTALSYNYLEGIPDSIFPLCFSSDELADESLRLLSASSSEPLDNEACVIRLRNFFVLPLSEANLQPYFQDFDPPTVDTEGDNSRG